MGDTSRARVAALLTVSVLAGCYRSHELDRDASVSGEDAAGEDAASFAPCAIEAGTGELILGGRSQPMVAHAFGDDALIGILVASPHSDVRTEECGHSWGGGAVGSPDETVIWLTPIWLGREAPSQRALVPQNECTNIGCAEAWFTECAGSGGCHDEYLSGRLEIMIFGAGPRTFCARLTGTAADGRELTLEVHSRIEECDG